MASDSLKRPLIPLLGLAALAAAIGCGSTECLRHTDCGHGRECSVGVCIDAQQESGEGGATSSTAQPTSNTNTTSSNAATTDGAAGAGGAE